MSNIAIIFPNQLFEIKYIPYDVNKIDLFIIVEDCLYFSDNERALKFNMLKLIYQRASMKYYEHYLQQNKLKVLYLNYQNDVEFWYKHINGKNIKLYFMDPTDHLLTERIMKFTKKYKFNYEIFETSMFLCSLGDLKEYNGTKQDYYQYNFYIWQRNRLNILMNGTKPIGGKYSFDKDNRKPIPGKDFNEFITKNKIKYPKETFRNEFYSSAIKYCEKTFVNHYTENYVPDNIYLYPITHSDVLKHFKTFIKFKLEYFAAYQDAISSDNVFMFHSVISPQLNNGLITPKQIIDILLRFYNSKSTADKKHILTTIEAYIRQLNWREYSRMLYLYADMKKNYFGNNRHLNKSWYIGQTGILPIDLTIKEAFRFGYIHHIKRLMVMCNFMNLCKIHPDDVYNWFMEFSLDSYDWIMINNVYSMGMFADGGLTTTKVYISTGNYIKTQSDIKPDGVWDVIWRILYYYFIYINYDKLNDRSAIYKHQWDKCKDQDMIKKEGKKLILKLTK